MERCPDCAAKVATVRVLETRRRNRDAVLARAAVPGRFRMPVAALRWPRDPRHPEQPLERWRGEPWSVTIQGQPGVGKSQLAVEMLYRWQCEDSALREVFWIRAGALVRAIVLGHGESERARTCQLLVLDDYGQGMGNRTAWLVLGEVLAERYDRESPTLVTTNLRQTALERAHAATADRLRSGLICELRGQSRRG
jgi:DNA replication protein DnaC